MSQTGIDIAEKHGGDRAPGDGQVHEEGAGSGVRNYLIGLGLAILLTAASFYAPHSTLIYGPGIPVALIVFAIAQMGVHLVFFLHITTGPDNTNNVLALAFGVLIVMLLLIGTLFIMSHLNANMPQMNQMMQMQR
jgi:cytochrome o ubiquinol oxidase subunit IV